MRQQIPQLEHFGLRCQEDTDDTGSYCHQSQSQHRSLNVHPGASPDSTDNPKAWWVDCELPNQWYQRRMYLLHSNLRTVQNDLRVAQNVLRAAQDDLRAAQDELVQVNAERGRVAFFNKVLMLLVVAMVIIKFM
ncbi:hypothetical protein Tco_1374101 [Tanacetum coccineum]